MKSLKGKIIVAVCVICIICIGTISAISYGVASSILSDKTDENMLVTGEKYSNELDGWFGEQEEQL